jgi:hypothetical protein
VLGAGAALAGIAGAGWLSTPTQAAGRFPGADQYPADIGATFEFALELVQKTPGYSPPVASQAFGYAGVTLYEAVVPGMEGWRSLPGLRDGRDHAIDLLDASTGADAINVHAVDAAWTSEASSAVHSDNGQTS